MRESNILANFVIISQLRKKNLKVHTQAKHESTKYTCSMCNFRKTVKGHLERHQQALQYHITFDSDLCEHQANTSASLKLHTQSVQEWIRFICLSCEYQATTKQSLKRIPCQLIKVLNTLVNHAITKLQPKVI